MLISFAPSRPDIVENRTASSFMPLSDYLDSPFVLKNVAGKKKEKRRNPAPEILVGNAKLLRDQIASLTYKSPFSFVVLSFAPEDIDINRFNHGDPHLRWQIDQALVLLQETLFPGIPKFSRPLLYITTHSHVRRLEINVVVPHSIVAADNRTKSYNPDFPTGYSAPSRLWSACQDLLNWRFGWADPSDPSREKSLKMPNWIAKLQAEAARAGLKAPPNLRQQLTGELVLGIRQKKINSRADVCAFLTDALSSHGMEILGSTPNSITVGCHGSAPKDRLRLKGPLFRENLDVAGMMDPTMREKRRQERLAELATAPARFLKAFEDRARYNLNRFGRGAWRHPIWSVDTWLANTRHTTKLRIPLRHHVQLLFATPKKGPLNDTEAVRNGAPLPEPDAHDSRRLPNRDRQTDRSTASAARDDLGARTKDRGVGKQPETSRPGLERLNRVVGALKKRRSPTNQLKAALQELGQAIPDLMMAIAIAQTDADSEPDQNSEGPRPHGKTGKVATRHTRKLDDGVVENDPQVDGDTGKIGGRTVKRARPSPEQVGRDRGTDGQDCFGAKNTGRLDDAGPAIRPSRTNPQPADARTIAGDLSDACEHPLTPLTLGDLIRTLVVISTRLTPRLGPSLLTRIDGGMALRFGEIDVFLFADHLTLSQNASNELITEVATIAEQRLGFDKASAYQEIKSGLLVAGTSEFIEANAETQPTDDPEDDYDDGPSPF